MVARTRVNFFETSFFYWKKRKTLQICRKKILVNISARLREKLWEIKMNLEKNTDHLVVDKE
jgi:hypothetical protein